MRWLLLLGVLGGCATPTSAAAPKKQAFEVHIGDSWYRYRGGQLGLTRSEARERDLDIDESGPPTDAFWGPELAVESAALWRALCNECHRGVRSISGASVISAPAQDWGRSTGRFFGRVRHHRQIFRAIYSGSTNPKGSRRDVMPGWGTEISREQIWGLVYYLEYQTRSSSNLRK
jgi:hypothetical protein